MEIKDANNNVILSEDRETYPDKYFVVADSSYHYQEIMGDNNIVLNFSLTYYYDFPVGCTVLFHGQLYTMMEIFNVTKINNRQYDYTLTFESAQKVMSRYKFRNMVDGRLNFTLTAKPQEFLQHIVDNINARTNGGWLVGDFISSAEKTQSFSHNSIIDALNSVAQLFDTEYEIDSALRVINLKKVEYYKDTTSPLILSYGKGNGFKSGVARQKGSETAIDVLWVEGGERNIDQSKYTYTKVIEGQEQTLHANKLRLPKNLSFYYTPPADDTSKGTLAVSNSTAEGRRLIASGLYAAWDGQESSDVMAVTTDEDGFGVSRRRADWVNDGYEDSVDLTDVYPKKLLYVQTAELEGYADNDREQYSKRFWNIIATTSDGSLIPNYNDCMIAGQEVTIVFNTGMLAGKEFNLSDLANENALDGNKPKCYNTNRKLFKICPTSIDGIVMPDLPLTDIHGDPIVDVDGKYGTGYVPAVGDEFAVFHVNLPQEYIYEAERDLLLEACHYLYKHSQVEIEFSGTVDDAWSKSKWADIEERIRLGSYIRFYDNAFCQEGRDIRILNIKTYLNNPHAPELTLSNTTVSLGVSSELKKIPQSEQYTRNVVEYTERDIIRYTEKTFTATEDALDQLDEDAKNFREETAQNFSDTYDYIDFNDNQLNDYIDQEHDINEEQGRTLDEHGDAIELHGEDISRIDKDVNDPISGLKTKLQEEENKTAEMAENWQKNFDDGITPTTIKTMDFLCGDRSLQFELGECTNIDSTTLEVLQWTKTQAVDIINGKQLGFNAETNTMYLPEIHCCHKVYNSEYVWQDDEQLTGHSQPKGGTGKIKYPYWWIEAKAEVLDPDDTDLLYIYIMADGNPTKPSGFGKMLGSHSSPNAQWVLSKVQLAITNTAKTKYFFLYGMLDCNRAVGKMSGYTSITGNEITTGTIKSADGNTYFDLEHSIIGGQIKISDGTIQNELILGTKNTPNKGGMTGRNIYLQDAVAAFQGRAVRFWIGNESRLETLSNGKIGLFDAEIVFFVDGSFYFKKRKTTGNEFWYDAINNKFSTYGKTEIRSTLKVNSTAEIGSNTTIGGMLTVASKIVAGAINTSHILRGWIWNQKKLGNTEWLGVAPMTLWHGFINFNGNPTSCFLGEGTDRRVSIYRQGQDANSNKFNIRIWYYADGKAAEITLPQGVNRNNCLIYANQYRHNTATTDYFMYFNVKWMDSNNKFLLVGSWDGDREKIQPCLLTIMYVC